MSQPTKLNPDERIWPLKPEVMLARGKSELQAKEDRAVRGAVKDAVTTYKNETATLQETNAEDIRRKAKLLAQSVENAEEILIRDCTYDRTKKLKYRGKCAVETSENIDQEIATLNNALNVLSNKRKQRTKALLDQQKALATMQVTEEVGITYPEEEQLCYQLECKLEKAGQKMAAADRCHQEYLQFINTLRTERKLYGPRLENLKKCINQDIYDLQVCHDVMIKGDILEQDAAGNLEETSTNYTSEKKNRDYDLKSMRKEVQRKTDQTKGKKLTLMMVTNVLKSHQNVFDQIRERRRTLAALEDFAFEFDFLREATRCADIPGVVAKFEGQVDRHTYLSNERERIETQKRQQMEALQDHQAVLSSTSHTGAAARQALDNRLVQLESQLRVQQARQNAARERLQTLGGSLSGARGTLRQLLRALKFVSRPQGWVRREGHSELIGDLELLRYKISSLQQRFVALGAPLRPDSSVSISSSALDVHKAQYRAGRQAGGTLHGAEVGKVDDMEPLRVEMKHVSEDLVKKMTSTMSRERRPL